MGGLLIWEYPWWNRSFDGFWLIFFFGYFHFFVATILVLALKSHRARILVVASLYILAAVANIVCLGFLGWVY
jgi:fatty acid desaturase